MTLRSVYTSTQKYKQILTSYVFMYFTSVNMMESQHVQYFMDLSVKEGLKKTCIQVETCCLCNRAINYLCLTYHCSTSLVLSKRNVMYSINFIFQLTHTTLKNVELLKHFKISTAAPTCFGLQGNHHQGATDSTQLKLHTWFNVDT